VEQGTPSVQVLIFPESDIEAIGASRANPEATPVLCCAHNAFTEGACSGVPENTVIHRPSPGLLVANINFTGKEAQFDQVRARD